jgi:hypothetical protein
LKASASDGGWGGEESEFYEREKGCDAKLNVDPREISEAKVIFN